VAKKRRVVRTNKRPKTWDMWKVWSIPFKTKKGVPLHKVIETMWKECAMVALPPQMRERIVGPPVRIMCPKCGVTPRQWYVIWEYRDKKGGILAAFHLYRAAAYDKGGRPTRWEVHSE
jgi:hypothetical protein